MDGPLFEEWMASTIFKSESWIEQLKFESEKIIGIWKHQEKLENIAIFLMYAHFVLFLTIAQYVFSNVLLDFYCRTRLDNK